MIAEDSPLDRAPGRASRIVLAASFAHPDRAQPLRGLLELRDAEDQIADGFDERRLELAVRGGSLSKGPTRLAAGLYGFEVTAHEDSGGERMDLRLSFDGEVLASRQVPIGTDRWLAEGSPIPRGGCQLGPRAVGVGWFAAMLALLTVWRRRSKTWS